MQDLFTKCGSLLLPSRRPAANGSSAYPLRSSFALINLFGFNLIRTNDGLSIVCQGACPSRLIPLYWLLIFYQFDKTSIALLVRFMSPFQWVRFMSSSHMCDGMSHTFALLSLIMARRLWSSRAPIALFCAIVRNFFHTIFSSSQKSVSFYENSFEHYSY